MGIGMSCVSSVVLRVDEGGVVSWTYFALPSRFSIGFLDTSPSLCSQVLTVVVAVVVVIYSRIPRASCAVYLDRQGWDPSSVSCILSSLDCQ